METKAYYTHNGDTRELELIDEYGEGGSLFIAGFESGARWLIRARTIGGAWEAWIDSLPAIGEDEVPEAYGFDGWDSAGVRTESVYSPETAAERFRAAIDAADSGNGEYPDLIEGYEYQPNARGTGIVNLGHYAWMDEVSEDRVNINITVTGG